MHERVCGDCTDTFLTKDFVAFLFPWAMRSRNRTKGDDSCMNNGWIELILLSFKLIGIDAKECLRMERSRKDRNGQTILFVCSVGLDCGKDGAVRGE